jgi:polar amino acid transport system permease protein
MGIIKLILEYRHDYLAGLWVTIKLCLLAWGVGVALGGSLALATEWWPRLIGKPMAFVGRIAEAIPILVLLFVLHYPVQHALNIVVDPFWTTAALLAGLNTLAVYSILRRAIHNIPEELVEVARVCGVIRQRIFWRIKLPLALRSALGSLTSAQVATLQLSIFGSLISVPELFRVSQRIVSQKYDLIEAYTILAGFFLIVCLPLNLIASRLERRLA